MEYQIGECTLLSALCETRTDSSCVVHKMCIHIKDSLVDNTTQKDILLLLSNQLAIIVSSYIIHCPSLA